MQRRDDARLSEFQATHGAGTYTGIGASGTLERISAAEVAASLSELNSRLPPAERDSASITLRRYGIGGKPYYHIRDTAGRFVADFFPAED